MLRSANILAKQVLERYVFSKLPGSSFPLIYYKHQRETITQNKAHTSLYTNIEKEKNSPPANGLTKKEIEKMIESKMESFSKSMNKSGIDTNKIADTVIKNIEKELRYEKSRR